MASSVIPCNVESNSTEILLEISISLFLLADDCSLYSVRDVMTVSIVSGNE